jgi:hypothetical protein
MKREILSDVTNSATPRAVPVRLGQLNCGPCGIQTSYKYQPFHFEYRVLQFPVGNTLHGSPTCNRFYLN